ncbi:putative ribonuclease YlaK [Arthrobacter psychrochitiniphilus]|nr:putative ribonuclease YlaK [Arthrobacter psychrochitiniphilus]
MVETMNLEQQSQRRHTTAALRTYVIDTSVLLSDPRAVTRFAEHQVVVPIVVVTELERKRHDPELGYFARTALRLLDELGAAHGGFATTIALGHCGWSTAMNSWQIRDGLGWQRCSH